MAKARRWAFTWNNYTDEQVTVLKGLSADKVDYLIFGFEIAPETGTKHLQGYVEFASPMAVSTVKSRLDPVKKGKSVIHVEKCEGTRDQNLDYVRKAETKDPEKLDDDGNILIIEVAHNVREPGKRTDWHACVEAIREKPEFETVVDLYPEIAIKYHAGVEKIIRSTKQKKMMEQMRDDYEHAKLRPWQEQLIAEVQKKADGRKIIWYYDEIGNSGKTWVSKLLYVNHGAAYFTNGKNADITFAYGGEPIVIFDFSRSNEDSINYGVIESVKNGIMFSPKYEARTKMFSSPHVIVMANFKPAHGKMSEDRWDIRTLEPEKSEHSSGGGNTEAAPLDPAVETNYDQLAI